jgi:hypothetical protein
MPRFEKLFFGGSIPLPDSGPSNLEITNQPNFEAPTLNQCTLNASGTNQVNPAAGATNQANLLAPSHSQANFEAPHPDRTNSSDQYPLTNPQVPTTVAAEWLSWLPNETSLADVKEWLEKHPDNKLTSLLKKGYKILKRKSYNAALAVIPAGTKAPIRGIVATLLSLVDTAMVRLSTCFHCIKLIPGLETAF